MSFFNQKLPPRKTVVESLRFNERHASYVAVPVATKNAPQLNESHSEL